MKDKMLIGYGPLADFSTAPWGVLNVKDGKVILNEVKVFNRARLMPNAGANIIRVLRRGIWEITTPFDWDHPDYFPLLRKYLAIMHQPFQGPNPPPGVDIVIDIFDGCSETWMYDPINYNRARNLLRGMFDNLGDLDYVKFSVGNECNHPDSIPFVRDVVYPEFFGAGKVPFKFGAAYSIYDDWLEKQKPLMGMVWGDKAENSCYRAVHGVRDENSINLIDACRFWMPANNPISIWFSVDGVWDGENSCDYEGNHRRPSPEQIKRAMKYWMDRARSFEMYDGHQKFAFEYLPKARNNDSCAVKGVLAISEVYAEKFGWPENYGQYPDDWKEPVTPPPPPPIPEPVKPPVITWQGWLGLTMIAVTIVLLIILL